MFLQAKRKNIFTSNWDFKETFSSYHVENQQARSDNQMTWVQAKPLSEIPSPPKQFLIGHAKILAKNAKRIHRFHEELHREYGNIVLLSVPGQNMVCIYDPEDSRILLSNDGRTPTIGGFDSFVFYR